MVNYSPVYNFEASWIEALAFGVAVIGLFISGYALVKFHSAGTTHSPFSPNESQALVVAGPYTFSRNPMYLGLLLVLFSFALYLGDCVAFVIIPFFVVSINYLQIVPEEKALESNFGERYREYSRRVRRWL